jgi:hypothetical protein
MEYIFKSLEYGIVPTLIVLAYLLVTRYFDSKKELKKLEKEKEEAKRTVKINAEILDAFNELNTFLKHITKDIVKIENDKCVAAIKSSFRSMNFGLTRFATFTIINNNIDVNSNTIKDNIFATVEAEYLTVYNELLLYKDDDKFVADYMKSEWKEQLAKDMISIIFNKELTKEQRIYNVHNKLGINIAKYANYVNNKYIADND